MDKLTLELKLTVDGTPKEVLREYLAKMVSIGMGGGLLTRDTPATVDTHHYEITEVE